MRQGPDEPKAVTLTREELYELVWETPMSKLAVQYGISGNGLAKICDRLDIRYPPRGYWAKKAAGKKTITYRLPDAGEHTPPNIVIRPTPPPTKPPELPPEVKKKVDTVLAKASSITVPQRLVRPHPIVAGWIAKHEQNKKEARRDRDPWMNETIKANELTQIDRRMNRILNTLFKTLERHGAEIEEGDRGALFVVVQGEKVEFLIREKNKQIRRPLTEDEKRWWNSGKKWMQELHPTGKLLFAIKTYLPRGLREEWLETDAKPMETLLPDIIACFLSAGPLLADQRREREEAERVRQAAEQERQEERRRLKKDDNRWRRFVDISKQWRDAELAREFLAELRKAEMALDDKFDSRTVGDWIRWVEGRLETDDPLNHGASAIFRSVASVNEWNYRE